MRKPYEVIGGKQPKCPPPPPAGQASPPAPPPPPWNAEALKVQILRAEPGDVVVVSTEERLTVERADRIRAVFNAVLPPGVKGAVLDAGMRLEGVVRPDPSA